MTEPRPQSTEEWHRQRRRERQRSENIGTAIGGTILILWVGFCLVVILAVLKLALWVLFGW